MGSAERCIDIKVEPVKSIDSYQLYDSGFSVENAFSSLSAEVQIPTISVESINKEGLLVINFSDKFIPITDFTKLTKKLFNVGGVLESGLQIFAIANEG